MEWRNAKQTQWGTYDCEINHPVRGWEPFHAVQGDTGSFFDVDAMILEIEDPVGPGFDPYVAPSAADVLEAAREAAMLSRAEFSKRAVAGGHMTYPEATAYVRGESLPAAVEAIISQQPAEEQDRIRFDVLTEEVIRRNAALIPAIGATFGLDEAGMDTFFGIEV